MSEVEDDECAVVLFGASNVLILAKFLPDNWDAVAYPGYTSQELLLKPQPTLRETLAAQQVDWLVLSVGANDTGTFFEFETMAHLRMLADPWPAERLIVLAPPLGGEVLLGKLTDEFPHVVNMYEYELEADGLHLTDNGAIALAEQLILQVQGG